MLGRVGKPRTWSWWQAHWRVWLASLGLRIFSHGEGSAPIRCGISNWRLTIRSFRPSSRHQAHSERPNRSSPKRAIDCLDTEPGADQEIAKGIDRLDRMFDLMNGNQLICSKMVSITGLVIYSECGVKRYAVTLEDIKVISQEMSWGCEKLKSLCKEELGLVDRNPRRTRTPFLLFMLREWIANMLGRRREEGSS